MSLEQALGQLEVITTGEGFIDLTPKLNNWIKDSNIFRGSLNITSLHTSCSLTINENADPRVLEDLSVYIKSIVPEGGIKSINGLGKQVPYQHADEGSDDMPAHIRTALTCTCLTLTIDSGALVLGTWQAVYLWEHRYKKHFRKLSLQAIGERKAE